MSKILFKIKNLTKVFGNGESTIIAVKNVSLEINSGDFIAITGSSGSGKTTFLNILAGLLPTTEGEIFFNSSNILSWNDSQKAIYRNLSIGYVMQNFGLINTLNVINNVLLPVKKNKKKFKDEAINNLSLFNIQDKEKSFPYQLSGGQKQRVAIARSLINNPDIILADEPTGSLDLENSQKIIDIFKEINMNGKTIILVTHEESIAKQCKKIVRFQDGEIIEIKILNQ